MSEQEQEYQPLIFTLAERETFNKAGYTDDQIDKWTPKDQHFMAQEFFPERRTPATPPEAPQDEKEAPAPIAFRDPADVLLEFDMMDTTDIVEKIIPAQAITLITGDPKVGKTTLLYRLIDMMTSGDIFCDLEVRSVVCWILTDEGTRSLGPLLRRVGPRIPTNHKIIQYGQMADYSWPQIVNGLIKEYNRIKKTYEEREDRPAKQEHSGYPKTPDPELLPDVIIVDTLGQWTGMQDINAYHNAITAFKWLKKLRDTIQVAVIPIHHTNKGGGDTVHSSLGSTGIPGQSDHIVTISKDSDDDCKRHLDPSGRFDDLTEPLVVAYNKEDGSYVRSYGRKHQETKTADLLRLFEDKDELKTSDVAKAWGCSNEIARRQIRRAEYAGFIESNGKGGNQKGYRLAVAFRATGEVEDGTED